MNRFFVALILLASFAVVLSCGPASEKSEEAESQTQTLKAEHQYVLRVEGMV